MAWSTSGEAGGLLGLIDIKAPIAATSDGGFAVTLGVAACNAGIQIGGRTGIEAFAECGPLYAKAGIGNDASVYAIAGIEDVVEVGAGASLNGASAYLASMSTGTVRGVALSSAGFGTFTLAAGADGGEPVFTAGRGGEQAAVAAAQLVGSLASLGGPSSYYVPSLSLGDLGGLGGLLGLGGGVAATA